MDIKELEQIIKILKDNGVTEFELQQDSTHIKLSRGQLIAGGAMSGHSVVYASAPAGEIPVGHYAPQPVAGEPPRAQGGDEFAGCHKVTSPIVGTFYKRPSPDADPFVQEGAMVKKGDTLCIVEAMKLMNEIEAPISGRIVRVLPQDSQVVEFAELLVVIDPR